jgi:hypothetical protein
MSRGTGLVVCLAAPFAAVSALAACAGERSTALNEPAGVVLVITADPALFAPGATLEVRVWNAEQLLALEQNSRCSVVHDPRTGASQVRCPEGIEYREVVPEEFRRPVGAASPRVEIRSERIRVGTEFRVRVSGKSADGCNTTSASFKGKAGTPRVLLEALDWETTLRACAGGPARP